jgi:tRNA (cmo5U34)-methyltransferase
MATSFWFASNGKAIVEARSAESRTREAHPVSVAGHLRIDLDEYDARIRTFVPGYEEMIGRAAAALRFVAVSSPTIVDLGIGTGALSAACLQSRPDARIVGVDSDPGMLVGARARLAEAGHVELIESDFQAGALPKCDAFVACISLHHIRTEVEKRAFYRRCFEALVPSGILVTADCFPGKRARVAEYQREAWLAHLTQSYTRKEAEQHLESWAGEDVYFPLADEIAWLQAAGFGAEVLWRRDAFAVVAGFKDQEAARTLTP